MKFTIASFSCLLYEIIQLFISDAALFKNFLHRGQYVVEFGTAKVFLQHVTDVLIQILSRCLDTFSQQLTNMICELDGDRRCSF